MLTRLIVRNFKRFDDIDIELGNPVVFIGPNNSGKTSALQALALWGVGLKKWNEKRQGRTAPEKRPGVTVNRRDLISVPMPEANLLWRNLHVRDVRRTDGKQETKNVLIEVQVEGISEDAVWTCGLEFDYANEESFYCRPLRKRNGDTGQRMPIPDQAGRYELAFLPPMSGLASNETRLDVGAINVRVGEGRTAEVLRNLCYRAYSEQKETWEGLVGHIRSLFGSTLEPPRYIGERGEIVMSYVEHGTRLDISSSGRGLQQTLLLLAYMYANPRSVLLLDEPDAHLEILRQRQIYQLLTDVARTNGNQIIAASHSEVILNEAAARDVVVAFVGAPHRMNKRGTQLRKALQDIGFEDYYLAEETGWVLYLEGSTDLAVLQVMAERLGHGEAQKALERPFVHYIGNVIGQALHHFHGLREAAPGLQGIAIVDRQEALPPESIGLEVDMWRRREIENYLCHPDTLLAYAQHTAGALEMAGPLFQEAEQRDRAVVMREAIAETENAMQTLGKGSPWDANTKVSDEFLTPVFANYYKKLDLPNVMSKKNFHELGHFVPMNQIDPEITEKLDLIGATARRAKPSPLSE